MKNLDYGYVYLIEDSYNETYKIGRTKRNPYIRLKELQTGNSTNLNLVSYYKTLFPCRMESMLHNRYQFNNVKSEWFYLTKEQKNNFLNSCEEIENIINVMKENPFFVGKGLK